MKILFATNSGSSYATVRLTAYLNEHTEHEARILLDRKNIREHYACLVDEYVPLYNHDNVRELVEWADVVHCIWKHGINSLNAADLIDKKVWVYGWIGFRTLESLVERLWKGVPKHKVKWQHTIHGHDRYPYFQELKKNFCYANIPRFIDWHKPYYGTQPLQFKRRVIGFYPSYADRKKPYMKFNGLMDKSWHKNWNVVKEKCGDLAVETNNRNIPYTQLVSLKRHNICNMDDITTPILSNFAFESLACGTPCITAYDNFTKRQVFDTLQCGSLPFIEARPETVREVAGGIFNMTDEQLAYRQREARQWMEDYYSPARVAAMYIEFYER